MTCLSQSLWQISLLSPPVLSGYNGSPDIHFSRGTTRLINWPDGERYLRPLQYLAASLSLVSTLAFSRTGGVLSHLNSTTDRFPRFPQRNLCSLVTLAMLSLIFAAMDTRQLSSSYPLSAHFISSPSAPSPPSLTPSCPSMPPASSPSLTLSGFFNGILEISEPGALNYFTFFRPILSTLSASKNQILTHLSLYRFLDSLLCVLIAPTPGLAFSLVMPRTPAAALPFSSGRAYPSLNFLPPLFLC